MIKKILIVISLIITIELFAIPKISGDLETDKINLNSGNFADVAFSILPFCDAALVVGFDGTAVYIPSYAFKFATLENIDDVWNLKSDFLSPVTNIRNISEICLQQVPANYSIKLANCEISQISPFLYRLGSFELLGESEKNGYTVRKYKLRSENDFWNGKTIDKIISTNNKIYQATAENIIFQNYYFQVENDTISTIIFKIEEKTQ